MISSRKRLAETIAQRCLDNGNTSSVAKEVAAYLLETKQVGSLSSILRDIQVIWSEQGLVEVIARSAHPIDKAAEQEIKRTIKSVYPNAKQIIINKVLDEAILSGIKLELANKQLDLSAEAKLNQFRQLTVGQKGKK